MTGPRLEASGLCVGYEPGAPALTDVTFTAAPGQILALLGPNGGGKSTLLRALLGELIVLEGSYAVHAPVASVPQSEDARRDFPVTALDVALMGAYGRTPWYRRLGRADRVAATTALERVGLGDRSAIAYGALSRGQRQRVLIARALVQDAPILLLDEPFAGVDRVSAEGIMGVLADLRAEGRTLLVATHDIDQARVWDQVLCLNGRQVAFGPPAQALGTEALQATYGGEIIVLEDGRHAVAVGHHDHDHQH